MKTRKLLTTALLTFATAASMGQTDTRGSDKVDLKKLEDKYWSAKDDDYGVIQNRTFSKAGKMYVSGVYGPLVNDTFAKSRAAGLMAGYYFTEDFGIEAHYLKYDTSKSESVEGFNLLAANISPNYNLLESAYAVSATYTPFYAKMAFMNKAILYFDMGFTAGLGMSSYNQIARPKDGGGSPLAEQKALNSSPHFELGVMQQLFLNKNFAFRIDVKNSFYSQKVKNYQGNTGVSFSDIPETTKSANDTTITLGLTLFTN